MNLAMTGDVKNRRIKNIEDMGSFELLETLALAIKLEANPKYIDMLKEEIFLRMEVGEV